MKISRRKFIKTGGYVAVGFSLLPSVSWVGREGLTSETLQGPRIKDWLQVLEDGRVRIFTGKMELGQGIRIVIAQVAAEELNTDVDMIEVHLAETGVTPNEGYTAGSRSVSQSAMSVRRAAAAAAGIILDKASDKYGISRDKLYLKNGKVFSEEGGLTATFFEVLDGEQIEAAVPADVKTKPKGEHEIVGAAVMRKDIADMVRGKPVYVQDLRFPGMLHARMVRPPAYGGRLESINTTEAENLEDVVKIVVKNSFVGVLATDEYQAEKAGRLIQQGSKWKSGARLLPAGNLPESLKSLPVESQRAVGGDEVNFRGKTLKAGYFKPYIMHAAIGPSCAVAYYDGNNMQIWSHTQGVYPLRKTLPGLLGIPEEQIRITGVPGSGCYGHNGADDVAAEAALLALEIPGRHVRLQWTREDEHRWEPYGTAMLMELEAALTSGGKISGWRYDLWSDTHSTRPGGDKTSLLPTGYYEGAEANTPRGFLGGGSRNADPYYNFTNKSVRAHFFDGPLRVSALRSLGAYANNFAVESFMDELAEQAGADPVEFRLRHLDDSRAREVLQKVKEMTAEVKTEKGEGIGYAFARYKNSASYFAAAAKVFVDNEGEVHLRNMWGAIDSGEVMNPDGLKNQTEGGMIQSASWTLKEEVDYNPSGISSIDWQSYPIFRFSEVPEVKVEIINRPDEEALGAGEAAQGPTAAAIANALYKASGVRVRHLPIRKYFSPKL